MKDSEIKVITGRLRDDAEKTLNLKKNGRELKSKITAEEVVDEIDVKGLTKWMINRYFSTVGYFTIREVLKKFSKYVQKNIK